MADEDGRPWLRLFVRRHVRGYTGAGRADRAVGRKRTGRGQFVDLSQFGRDRGSRHVTDGHRGEHQSSPGCPQEGPSAPHGVYRCRGREGDDDRWVAISVRSQAEWQRLVDAMANPAWASDPKFRTLYLRMRNQAGLDGHISRWTMERSAEEAMTALQNARIAAGVVANGADLCARDPQLRERGFWPVVKTPGNQSTNVTGIPFRLSTTSGSIRSPGPEVGENNDYILSEILGLSPAEGVELIKGGIVWP